MDMNFGEDGQNMPGNASNTTELKEAWKKFGDSVSNARIAVSNSRWVKRCAGMPTNQPNDENTDPNGGFTPSSGS